MHDRGTYFVPTLYGFSVGLTPDSTPEERALHPRIEMLLKSGRQAVATARRLGVPVVAGTDTGYEEKEPTVIDEIMQLASAGLSNLEAIRSATSLSAECLEISSAKGALKPGWDADLVAYKSNPLKDLAVLREPILVINGGKVFLRKE
ncbi:MAG: amidohydrolase family protein, partial [Candidatus Aminicenantes bacterium]|nr:amidohydrolase family protein [Candidatus Aminicenantes bacterium]